MMIFNAKKWIFSIVFLILASNLFAGDKKKKKTKNTSLLWKIEHPITDEIDYLYGTIHLIPEDKFKLSQTLIDAFNKSDKIVLETDLNDPNLSIKMLQGVKMKNNFTLNKLLSVEEYDLFNRFFKEELSMESSSFNEWKPLFISSIIAESMIKSPYKTYEKEFQNMAKNHKKSLEGLESIDEQIGAIDKISYHKQAEMMVESIKNHKSDLESFQTLVQLYSENNLEELHNYIYKSREITFFEEELIINRNKNWIPILINLIDNNNSFTAVGAGHLLGENGLISLLQKEGYIITPIPQ